MTFHPANWFQQPILSDPMRIFSDLAIKTYTSAGLCVSVAAHHKDAQATEKLELGDG
jgi:hypothetical protein